MCRGLGGIWEQVGLPVESAAFVDHLRKQLVGAAHAVDRDYLGNTYFNIVDGKPRLAKLVKKPKPEGLGAVETALTKKLQALDLSLLDVLGDPRRRACPYLPWSLARHVGVR